MSSEMVDGHADLRKLQLAEVSLPESCEFQDQQTVNTKAGDDSSASWSWISDSEFFQELAWCSVQHSAEEGTN